MIHDVQTLTDDKASGKAKVVASLDLVLNVSMDLGMITGVGELARGGMFGAKIAAKLGADELEHVVSDGLDHGATDLGSHAATDASGHAAGDAGATAAGDVSGDAATHGWRAMPATTGPPPGVVQVEGKAARGRRWYNWRAERPHASDTRRNGHRSRRSGRLPASGRGLFWITKEHAR